VEATPAPVRDRSELETVIAASSTRAKWWPYRDAG
jgi:hypothetical protein